jgi:hypothetical protein
LFKLRSLDRVHITTIDNYQGIFSILSSFYSIIYLSVLFSQAKKMISLYCRWCETTT